MAAIKAGTKLGRYEIRSKIGEGGMGEVYRAFDQAMHREVAIKVLPTALSADKNRLARFEQEAQSAGALNHPNILVIHHIDAHDGAPYIVSELLEGDTLRERIGGVALSQRKAIDYALQVARGLGAAHEKGIVHRDLKPENIFITKDGRVKILDFGLAKLTEPYIGTEAQTDVPTRKVKTHPGTVMGTVGYMSPEQVRGQTVDHRSDIFSFGAVLYEMLAGQRAFGGDSTVETLNAILKEEPPDLAETNRNVAPSLERMVRHCLEKNPDERFQSARDLAFALEALTVSTSGAQVDAASFASAKATSRWRARLPWLVAGVAVLVSLLALALSTFRRAPSVPEARAVRFYINAPRGTNISTGFPVVSPDGQRIIFRAQSSDGKTFIWGRALDALDAQPLAGTEDAGAYFWSPDSRYVALFSGGKLKKMEATGGPAQVLADAPEPNGGAWSRAGVIVFSPNIGPLFSVSAAGGPAAPATRIDNSRGELVHVNPRFLPDGRHFLYLALSGRQENNAIYVASLDSPETRRLLSGTEAGAAYAPPGYLLFLRGTTLMAQPFDAERLELTGEPLPVAQNVIFNVAPRLAGFSVSDNGVLAYRSNTSANTQLTWFDRAGRPLGTVGPTADQRNLALSPDGRRVAVGRIDLDAGARDIWVIDLERGTNTRFTSDPANDSFPLWSPDGSRIVFSSQREKGLAAIYQKPANGTGSEELLVQANLPVIPTDWSRDGQYLLCQTSNDPKTRFDLWVLPLSGERKLTPLFQTEFNEVQGQFSPEGRWVAYASNESGRLEVYVQSFPPGGGKWQVSTNGGAQPQWRRDGRELFYMSGDLKLMAVEVRAGANGFEASLPRPLFNLHIVTLPVVRNHYVVSADGQRFLVNTLVEESAPSPLTVVMNWTADLKR